MVVSASWVAGWGWPVILGDARPEIPDCNNGYEGKQGLEQRPIDLAVGAVTDVGAYNILEDLADGEKEDGTGEIGHWSLLTQHSEDKDGLQDDKDEEEDKWCELIEDVKCDVPVVLVGHAACELVGPSKTGIEGDVASADEQCECGDENEAE